MFFDDDDMLKKAKKLKQSVNYQFCNNYLPGLLFYKPEIFVICFKDNDLIYKLLELVVAAMKEDGFTADKYKTLKCDFRVDRDKRIAGIVIEIPDAEIEPECNYVCVCYNDKDPRFFESELYEEGTYGLCSRNKEGMHLNHGGIGGDIRSADDMWNAVTEVLTNK